MTRLLLITGVLLAACGQRTETNTDLPDSSVSDSTIYSFINNAILHPTDSANFSVYINILDREDFHLTNDDSLALVKMDSLFTKSDIDFIYAQLKHGKDFKLNPKFLPDKKIISMDTLMSLRNGKGLDEFWSLFEKKFGGGFCTLSLPLFSKDKSTVIIRTGYSCGSLCGSGGTHIYKKVNGRWKRITSIDEWIS